MSTQSGAEHSGHRQRLRKKFIENGFDGFEPHEALEMCLFYAIPRKDTNALAHRLLDKYMTIGGVFDAPLDELEKDFGLSEAAAAYLKMLAQTSRLYYESKLVDGEAIDPQRVGEQFHKKFIGRTEETVALMLGDAKGKMVYFDIITKGSVNSTDVPIRKIVDISLRKNARFAYIAHNHPSGSALPSPGDAQVTKTIRDTLSSIGVTLMDHFIVTEDDYVSLRDSALTGSIFYQDE